MKRKEYLLAGVLVVVFLLFAVGIAGAEMKFYGRLDFGWFSKYIGGLSGSRAFNSPVLQQSLSLGLKNPIADVEARIWSSYSPRDGFNSDFGDEVDYMFNVSREVGGFRLGLGYAFYDMYHVGDVKGDLHAICFSVVSPPVLFKNLFFYLTLEEEFPTDKEILEGGFLGKLGAVYGIPRFLFDWDLNFNGVIGGHDGAYGKKSEPLSFARLTISLGIPLAKNMFFAPGVSFQKDLGHEWEHGGLAQDEVWGGANFSINF